MDHKGQVNRSGKNDLAVVRSRIRTNRTHFCLKEEMGAVDVPLKLTADHADDRFGSAIVGAAPSQRREGEQLDITITRNRQLGTSAKKW